MFSLVQVLTDIVFPEQARDYTIAVAQQTNAYRVSRYNIPDFLQDRPHFIQAECLANIQGAKNTREVTSHHKEMGNSMSLKGRGIGL